MSDPNLLEQRLALCRAAIEDALCNAEEVRQSLKQGRVPWWESCAPLRPVERRFVIEEVKKILLPEQPA